MDPVDESNANNGTWLERAFTALAMLGLVLLCLIVTITVLSRWLYRPLIPDDVLLVRELMVGVILLPLAAVTARGAHISVTVFTNWLRPAPLAWLARLGYAIGLALVGALLWIGQRLFRASWESGDYHDGDIYIPMWIGYCVFMIALAAFAVRLAAQIVRPSRRAD